MILLIWLCSLLGLGVLVLGIMFVSQHGDVRLMLDELDRKPYIGNEHGEDDDGEEPIDYNAIAKKTIVRPTGGTAPKSSLDIYIESIGGERPALEHVLKNFELLEADFTKLVHVANEKSVRVKKLENFLQCANTKRKKLQKSYRKIRGHRQVLHAQLPELRQQLEEVSRVYDGLVTAIIERKSIHVSPPHRIAWGDGVVPSGMPETASSVAAAFTPKS